MSNAVVARPGLGIQSEQQTGIEGHSLSTRAEGYFEKLQETGTDSTLLPGFPGIQPVIAREAIWATPITLRRFTTLSEPTPIMEVSEAFHVLFDRGFRTLLWLEAPKDAVAESAIEPVIAAEELKGWLELTWDDLHRITGIATNTFHDWRRTDRIQRPSKVRRLMRVHALARAVRAHLGPERAAEWFRSGPDCPLDLLFAGDLDDVEDAAGNLLFRRDRITREDRHNYAPFAPEPDDDTNVELRAVPLRRAQRGPRRGRLPKA